MPGDMESAANSLSEQTKKLQIALYYTSGDEEKAKRMMHGSYNDLVAIKGKFSTSSVNGAFLIFLNTSSFRIINNYTLVSRSFELLDIKTSQDWRNFEKRMVEIAKQKEFDESMTVHMRDSLYKALTFAEVTKIVNLIEKDDGIAANHIFQKLISDVTGFQNIKLSIDYEKTNSITMELCSATSSKMPAGAEPGKEKLSEQEIKIEKLDDFLEGKEVKLIMNGSVVLSPVKGKGISELVVGDRIMVNLLDKSPRVNNVLKAFNAFREDGSPKPIPGRIVSIEKADYFQLFVIVAKGIFVKIVEEENTIKVALDSEFYNSNQPDEDDSKNNRMVIMVLTGVFFVLVGVILFFVLRL